MKKTKRKLSKTSWFLLLCVSVFLFSLAIFKLIFWHQDNLKTAKQIEHIDNDIKTTEIEAPAENTMINAPIEDNKNDDYWNYITLPLINVDFNELKKKNSDTVAFLKVNGTNINYPVVQTNNNNYYLTHSFDKSKNDAGWVYLDYRNDITKLDQNNIIYAHGRWDTTMFGSLKNVFKNKWYQNTDNYVLHLSTPTYNSLWQIFSVYKIPTETYYLTSSFGTTESYQKFLTTIQNRSELKFNASLNTNDKIITLSTCYDDETKVVLHAKLIKLQFK